MKKTQASRVSERESMLTVKIPERLHRILQQLAVDEGRLLRVVVTRTLENGLGAQLDHARHLAEHQATQTSAA